MIYKYTQTVCSNQTKYFPTLVTSIFKNYVSNFTNNIRYSPALIKLFFPRSMSFGSSKLLFTKTNKCREQIGKFVCCVLGRCT